jgi:Na+-driven multidrug efflux pump
MTLILAFAAMIGTGGAAYASIKLGQKRKKSLKKP